MSKVLLECGAKEDEFGDFLLFATIAEAQAHAETQAAENFKIYTLYAEGQRPIDIRWNFATDHATNERENKKANLKLRKGPWTRLEVDTLVRHYEAKMPLPDIAKALKRKYNSVFTKLKALGYK